MIVCIMLWLKQLNGAEMSLALAEMSKGRNEQGQIDQWPKHPGPKYPDTD